MTFAYFQFLVSVYFGNLRLKDAKCQYICETENVTMSPLWVIVTKHARTCRFTGMGVYYSSEVDPDSDYICCAISEKSLSELVSSELTCVAEVGDSQGHHKGLGNIKLLRPADRPDHEGYDCKVRHRHGYTNPQGAGHQVHVRLELSAVETRTIQRRHRTFGRTIHAAG